MTIKPGFKKITGSLEEANTLTLLVDRLGSKGSGSVFKTKDYAKENVIDNDEMNGVLEALANAGQVSLSGVDGEAVAAGDAQFTTHWQVEGITVHLKAHQKGLPLDGEDDGEEEEENE